MAEATYLPEPAPVGVPVAKPLSLIPVGLKEAALDSPTFRATAVHFCEQVDAVEKWLDGLVKSASKLSQEVAVLETLANAYLACSTPPAHLSEALIDQDYAAIALRRYNEGAREFWSHAIAGVKKAQTMVIEPIKTFLQSELRVFKDARRQLEQTQRYYDTLLSRYYGQTRTKDSSGLREDAFQLYEARKSYLKASMDFCIVAPRFRSSLDSMLIRVFVDRWFELKEFREIPTDLYARNGVEITRVRDWSREMQQTEKFLTQELQMARVHIEEMAETAARPSRDLDDYSIPITSQKPIASAPNSTIGNAFARQGWVFLRTVSGKPARYSWVRRWAFVKNGIFGWLVQGAKSGGVEESEKIGVLLCSVRLATQEDRRFCFEVITNDSAILLQAEDQADLVEWIAVFEKAKQRAFEEHTASAILPGGGSSLLDSAFAASSAIAPELAAKRIDGQSASGNDEVSATTALETESISSFGNRQGMERDGEHSHRIMQKLDLHRRSVASPTAASGNLASGGIASLISASHTAFSLATGRPQANSISDSRSPALTDHGTSLAPQTLANPPSATNLTRATILLGMERGYDLGVVDATGGVPSSIMANQWGSTNYGFISRMARVGVRNSSNPNRQSPDRQNLARTEVERSVGPQATTTESSSATDGSSVTPRSSRYRKPGSSGSPMRQQQAYNGFAEFPSYYPQALKAHDAQFRILFPNRLVEERVVLVFRTTWSPNGQQELSGRAFVTPDSVYFYSHNYFILVSSVELKTILEVSAVPGSHHDFLYVQVKGDGREEPSTVSLKVFLEPLRLLQRRLNFLVSNANSDEPAGLEVILQTLLRMDSEFTDQAHGVTNWEDHPIQRHVGPMPSNKLRVSLRVDRGLYDGQLDPDRPKFRLPAQAVQYTPPYVDHLAAERVFDISAKALFHMMFGDKSAVFQMLYRQRRSQAVKQYPWMKKDNVHFSREFEYDVETTSALGLSETLNIKDSQIIDVLNDHLCYVVSDRKTPWHLPSPEAFTLLTKVVITHVAKSRCKVACFTKVDWLSNPGFTKALLNRYALEDLHNDALSMLELVSDQVAKLGKNCSTQRAIQIFGLVGQQNAAAQITSTDPRVLPRAANAIKRKTLNNILVETADSFFAGLARGTVSFAAGSVSSALNVLSAHRIMTVIFFFVMFVQLLTSSRFCVKWWQERRAATFMASIGVQPHMIMSKGVYIRDLETSFNSSSLFPGAHSDNKCSAAFTQILAYMDRDAPQNTLASAYTKVQSRATARRLHHTRQRLAAYRHDLLVSLRLINRIERDSIQAEYETWVGEENAKCKKLAVVLSDGGVVKESKGAAGGASAELLKRIGNGGLGDVKSWYGEYCAACRAEQGLLEMSLM